MLRERCEAWHKLHGSDLWRNNNNDEHYARVASQALDGGRLHKPSRALRAWEL
jgi:hypothetical protein